MNVDLEISSKAHKLHIEKIAEKIGLSKNEINTYGNDKAKISWNAINRVEKENKKGNLVLVTAINPTPAGEGKTTTLVGLVDALNKIGEQASGCLREPSLGPCFGVKGGAAGGGHAQVVPMTDINLHFTGDIHAIGSANNLMAAMADNHMYQDTEPTVKPENLIARRTLDISDRTLRKTQIGIGGKFSGIPREAGFDITVASEVMAVFCLSNNLTELQERLGKIIVGWQDDGKPLTAKDIHANGSMAVLLKDALQPNLVQTLENNPVFIHGGPFANIAHGCNSVLATKTSLHTSKWTITEAGFGADLGAVKFFDIKARKAGLSPNAVVLVATVRALKHHGGADKDSLATEDLESLKNGIPNLIRHIENLQKFGVPIVVAVNQFVSDTKNELDLVIAECNKLGIEVSLCTHWSDGGKGCEDLAKKVISMASHKPFTPLYDENLPLWDKIEIISKEIFRANGVIAEGEDPSKLDEIKAQLIEWEKLGYKNLPICVAKTPASFSDSPKLLSAPTDFKIHIRQVSLSAAAGFIVVQCGAVMTMPGLPKVPAGNNIKLDEHGNIQGLF